MRQDLRKVDDEKRRGEHPAQIMQEFVDALAPGSYVAISHFFDPENEDSAVARELEEVLLMQLAVAAIAGAFWSS